MDLSDPDSLLRRVRWANVARLAALVVLAVLAALLPRLSSGTPAVPTGVAVPASSGERQPPVITTATPEVVPKAKATPKVAVPVARKHVRGKHVRHQRPHKRRRHRRPAKALVTRVVPPVVRRTPAPAYRPPPPSDSTTEFNPAAREFG